jgi:hypothetical protein
MGTYQTPPSIRVFHFGPLSNETWSNAIPAINFLSRDGRDMFAVNLRNLSQNLRELELTKTVIDWDFLFPLDDRDNPMALTSSLYWPYLEIVRLECVLHYFLLVGFPSNPRVFSRVTENACC